jgi:Flp pilus assembly protein TadD
MTTVGGDDCVLGRTQLKLRTSDGFGQSESYFRKITSADPRYPDASAGLAATYAVGGTYGWVPQTLTPQEQYKEAVRLAEEAVATAPSLVEAKATLAYVQTGTRQWTEAEANFQQALALGASQGLTPLEMAQTHHWYSIFLIQQRRFDEAKVQSQAAADGDPDWIPARIQRAAVCALSLNPDDITEAIADLDSIATATNSALAYRFLGQIHTHLEDFPEAQANLDKAETLGHLAPGDPDLLEDRGYLLAKKGDTSGAMTIIGTLTSQRGTKPNIANNIATVYAGLGDATNARTWLQNAIADKDSHLGYMNVDPKWDNVRDHPTVQPTFTDMMTSPVTWP